MQDIQSPTAAIQSRTWSKFDVFYNFEYKIEITFNISHEQRTGKTLSDAGATPDFFKFSKEKKSIKIYKFFPKESFSGEKFPTQKP